MDRNGDSVINDGSELFGDKTKLQDGTDAASGFEALAELDSNSDGVINTSDTAYTQLKVWQDENMDGISNTDELKSLEEAGISSISLNYTAAETTDETAGTFLTRSSSVAFNDGVEALLGEFQLDSDIIDSVDDFDGVISEDILALPNVRSVGKMPSLHNAMAKDTTGALKDLVVRFEASRDLAERESLVRDILLAICGVTDLDEDNRGTNIDARELAVVETVIGRYFSCNGTICPNPEASFILQRAFGEICSAYYCEMVWDDIKNYIGCIETVTDENGNTYKNLTFLNLLLRLRLEHGDVDEIIVGDIGRYLAFSDKEAFVDFKHYFTSANADYEQLIEDSCGGILGTSENDTLNSFRKLDTVLIGKAGDDSLSGTNGDELMIGGSGNDTLNGSEGNDVFEGGAGNDTLLGSVGDDIYFFGRGHGTDTITDSSGLNKIKFFDDIQPTDIVLSKVSGTFNLAIQIEGTEDKIILYNYFNTTSGVDYTNFIYIFSDGTVWTKDDITAMLKVVKGTEAGETLNPIYEESSLYGYGGDDTLYGSAGSDILDGGTGNDALRGQGGEDTYIFGRGYGTDTIYDTIEQNTIQFSEGISLTDIILNQNNFNLELQISGTEDKLVLFDYFRIGNGVDYTNFVYKFADGTIAAIDKENLVFQTQQSA